MVRGIVDQIKAIFEGDPGIRKVADDPALSAELLLLFRMMLADGAIEPAEMAALRRICRDSFGIPEKSIDGVIEYLNDVGYETNGAQALAMFQELPLDRRRVLAAHMADIAKADSQLEESELRLLKRSLDLLGLQPAHLKSQT